MIKSGINYINIKENKYAFNKTIQIKKTQNPKQK
jgi:hypothetical protein